MTGEVVSSYLTFDGEASLFVASGKTVESRIPLKVALGGTESLWGRPLVVWILLLTSPCPSELHASHYPVCIHGPAFPIAPWPSSAGSGLISFTYSPVCLYPLGCFHV